MNTLVMGLDLGQAADYTALTVVERVPQYISKPRRRHEGAISYMVEERTEQAPQLHCRHLERFPLGTRYPEIVETVRDMLTTSELRGAKLVVDATGVGRPVVDMFLAGALSPIAVLITGGDKVNHEDGYWRVPKRDLVAAVQVPLQDKRLKFAEGLPLIPTLMQEMLAFQVKITTSAHDTYGAWREGTHDDLILAVMLASWAAQNIKPRRKARSTEY